MKKKYILSIIFVLVVIILFGGLFYPNIKRSRESLKYTKLGDELWDRAIEETDVTLVAQAIKNYEEALKINPKNVDAYLELGHIYYMKRLDDQALAMYQKAVQVAPKSARAHRDLGLFYSVAWYRDERLLNKAIEEYEKAIELGETWDYIKRELQSLRKVKEDLEAIQAGKPVKEEKIEVTSDEAMDYLIASDPYLRKSWALRAALQAEEKAKK